MQTFDLSESIIIVQLPLEPQTTDEVETTTNIALERPDSDVILDCSKISTVSCQTLCGFMRLHKVLTDCKHCLAFCNIGTVTKGIFSTYGFDRVFEIAEENTLALEPLPDSTKGGTIIFANQKNGKPPQRRNYTRLNVPRRIKTDMTLWHLQKENQHIQVPAGKCYCLQGNLVDISEGGAQIAIDAAIKPDFQKHQFIGLALKVPTDQTSVTFHAQIREVLPSADSQHICLGLQFVGLEANPTGRRFLQEFPNLLGKYYQTEALAVASV